MRGSRDGRREVRARQPRAWLSVALSAHPATHRLRGFYNYVDHVMDNYSLRTFIAQHDDA